MKRKMEICGIESLKEKLREMEEQRKRILKIRCFLREVKRELRAKGIKEATIFFVRVTHSGETGVISKTDEIHIKDSDNEGNLEDVSINGEKIDWTQKELIQMLDEIREKGKVKEIKVHSIKE